jgi:hypothetical protein
MRSIRNTLKLSPGSVMIQNLWLVVKGELTSTGCELTYTGCELTSTGCELTSTGCELTSIEL